MISYHHICPLFIIVILTTSCSSDSAVCRGKRSDNSEFAVVAFVDGNNASLQRVVTSELRKNGIECYMDGSLGYAVMVPKSVVKRAKEVLLESRNVKSELIILPK